MLPILRSWFMELLVTASVLIIHFWQSWAEHELPKICAVNILPWRIGTSDSLDRRRVRGAQQEIDVCEQCELETMWRMQIQLSQKKWNATFVVGGFHSQVHQDAREQISARSLCAFCRVVVPTKPFTNTALYYKMLLESEPIPPATKCFWGVSWWIKSQCGSLQNGFWKFHSQFLVHFPGPGHSICRAQVLTTLGFPSGSKNDLSRGFLLPCSELWGNENDLSAQFQLQLIGFETKSVPFFLIKVST